MKNAKKLLVLAGVCGAGFVAAKNLDFIQEKLFNGKYQDEFLKLVDLCNLAADVCMWPVHYVKALLP